MRGELKEREDTAGITIGLSLSSGATVESSDSRRRSSAFVRFNVFPRPVCPLWSSHSPDFDRLICRLLTSFSLFRFYSLSAFLSPSTSLFLFPLSRCRSLSDLAPLRSLYFCLSAISTFSSRGNSLFACHAPPRSHRLVARPFRARVVYRFSSTSGNPLFLTALLRLERSSAARSSRSLQRIFSEKLSAI